MRSTVTLEDIKAGKVADVYFYRTKQILEQRGIHKSVTAEFMAKGLPEEYDWAVFSGLNEVIGLLKDLPVDVEAIPEGSIIHPWEPVLTITGDYLEFGVYETALLGYICQASGIATKAARVRKAAGDKPAVSFGARRMHPSIAPVVERNAYVGGCDGVASVAAAEYLEQDPVGTIPHALILIMGDTVEATKAFDEIIDKKVNRISLVDTFHDEKFEAIRVARELGNALYGIRLDTPGSRRGDLVQILREVRWELDLRGFTEVKLFVSGGLDEYSIHRYNEYADAYGVGTSVSAAKTIDFSMDIVDIEGEPIAKRGKLSGRKMLWHCNQCFNRVLTPRDDSMSLPECPGCGNTMKPLLQKIDLSKNPPSHNEVRDYVISQLDRVPLDLER